MAGSAAVGKTPVSVLQELLSRRGTTPKYELVQIEGAIHEPTFRYRVTVGDIVALGTGRSKKEAKHAAAKALLEKMMVNATSDNDSLAVNNNSLSEVKTEILSPYDNKIPGNPIGTLQEMCMFKRWPPPSYDLVNEEGLPHERMFTIACIVFKYRETGTAKSKKLAKRQAAHKMWERLLNMPITATAVQVLEEEDEITHQVGNAAANYSDLKDLKINSSGSSHNQKISQFHKQVKFIEGPKLTELQNNSLSRTNLSYTKFLQEIASEQMFDVTFVDIEEKSLTGKAQCLVQLSTIPVAVCYGSGNTTDEAQSSAAHNALEYLKILAKK